MGTEDLENQAAEITKAPWPLGWQPTTLLHLPRQLPLPGTLSTIGVKPQDAPKPVVIGTEIAAFH